jgi:DNA polymerase-3 subunit alpha
VRALLGARCSRRVLLLEVQRPGQAEAGSWSVRRPNWRPNSDLPLVATHPVQFLERDDFKAHEARVCIAEGYMLGDKPRPRAYTEQQYFKSPDEMAELFADLPKRWRTRSRSLAAAT